MKNKKKADGKDRQKDRVVLALSTEQAKLLSAWISGKGIGEMGPLAEEGHKEIKKIAARIEKTLLNQEAKRIGYPRGVKQMQEEGALELPGDVMEAIVQATQEAEKEIFISDEDRVMQVNTEIRPEPGIISDRRN